MYSKRKAKWIEGYEHNKGYLLISHNNTNVPIHRYLYEQYHQVQLQKDDKIDHENGNRKDNRISNLRLTDDIGNSQNRALRQDSKTGIKGVTVNPRGGYKAQITVNKKLKILGNYDSLKAAKESRLKAEQKANSEGAIFNQVKRVSKQRTDNSERVKRGENHLNLDGWIKKIDGKTLK